MSLNEPVQIISLGAGVQSSTMALMAACGEITPMPTCAIFADTQAEPESVYAWLKWLEGKLPFPVIRVTSGNLAEISTSPRKSKKSGLTYLSHSIPAFTLEGERRGMMFRQCTDKSKIAPLRKSILAQLKQGQTATLWMGISTDEAQRMKDSRHRRIVHRYPIINAGMSRSDCLEWMAQKGYPAPPRSACSFCPYHSDKEWLRLKTDEPDAFADAVVYEKRLQRAFADLPRLSSIPFLHELRKPLDFIDFAALNVAKLEPQLNLFGNECEGMCGV